MKLTKEALKRIIKEELEAVMSEGLGGRQGLIKYIMDINADERSKYEAVDLINQMGIDDNRAEDLAKDLSQSDPEEWLASWINYAQREVEESPRPDEHNYDSEKRKAEKYRDMRVGASSAKFEGKRK